MQINIAVLMPDDHVREMFVPPAVVQALSKLGNLRFNEGRYDPKVMADLLKDSHVCITGWGCPALDEKILAGAKDLRMAAHTGGAVAGIISDYLYDRGIRVISGNKIYAESVAEGTVAYMLAALRRIPYYDKQVQNGEWRGNIAPNAGLLDKKVGLVGFGAIARYCVPMLKAFRADVRVYDPYVSDDTIKEYGVTRAESLEELFSECEILSNHLPRTRETYHIIGKDLLNRMSDGSLFVNTARGSTVDENSLAEILTTGRISAILDVFETEPPPPDSKLRGLDNVVLMPHMAGPTLDRCGRVGLALAEDIQRMLAGRPLVHEITRDYAMKMTNDRLQLT